MNVLFLTSSYPTPDSPVGGVFVREHARAAALHANVAIVHLDRSPGYRGLPRVVRVEDDEFPTWRVSYPYSPLPLSMALHLVAAWLGWRAARKIGFEPDLIHAHFFLAGAPAVLLGKLHSKPVLVTEQWSIFIRPDSTELTPALRRIARFTFERADRVLPVSEALLHGIESRGIHGRFTIVPNVVDTELFKPGAERNGRLLAAGLLVRAKGYEFLLEAIRLLAASGRDAQVDIAGDGVLRADLERLAEEKGIAGRVRFLGVVSKPEVARMMSESALFVMASRFDNNPCVIIEALASGLPVVATAVGGIPEMIDGSSGRLARGEDPASIAAEIATALDELDTYDRPAIAEAARRRYGREQIGETFATLYRDALAGRP